MLEEVSPSRAELMSGHMTITISIHHLEGSSAGLLVSALANDVEVVAEFFVSDLAVVALVQSIEHAIEEEARVFGHFVLIRTAHAVEHDLTRGRGALTEGLEVTAEALLHLALELLALGLVEVAASTHAVSHVHEIPLSDHSVTVLVHGTEETVHLTLLKVAHAPSLVCHCHFIHFCVELVEQAENRTRLVDDSTGT